MSLSTLGGQPYTLTATTNVIAEPALPTHPSQYDQYDTKFRAEIQTRDVLSYLNQVKLSIKNGTNMDHETWGFYPGEQIAYKGGFGQNWITHHGVYVGDGIIIEFGGSQNCLLAPADRPFLDKTYECIGLSTLKNFSKRGDKQNSPIYSVSYPGFPDSNKPLMIKRLNRMDELVSQGQGRLRYWLMTSNCQSAASYISIAKWETVQGRKIGVGCTAGGGALLGVIYTANKMKHGKKVGIVNKDWDNPNCEKGSCKTVYDTEHGCICEDEPTRQYGVGKKYCHVSKKVNGCSLPAGYTNNGRPYDYVTGKSVKCVRKGGSRKKKYLHCKKNK